MRNPYVIECRSCENLTSKQYAAAHSGKCKACFTGTKRPQQSDADRNARIIDCGWEAYAREEGHYDQGD